MSEKEKKKYESKTLSKTAASFTSKICAKYLCKILQELYRAIQIFTQLLFPSVPLYMRYYLAVLRFGLIRMARMTRMFAHEPTWNEKDYNFTT